MTNYCQSLVDYDNRGTREDEIRGLDTTEAATVVQERIAQAESVKQQARVLTNSLQLYKLEGGTLKKAQDKLYSEGVRRVHESEITLRWDAPHSSHFTGYGNA